MAIEFITSLSNPTLVRHNQNHPNRFNDEINRSQNISKLSNEQLAKAVVNISDEKNLQATTLRFQENVPVTNLLKPVKLFNETNKPSSIISSVSDENNEAIDSEAEESSEAAAEKKTDTIGKGYYVVSSNDHTPAQKLLAKGNEDMIREKLTEIYNPSSKKENGTLVNLTF